MEGTLAKKTTGGKWKTRHFKIADGKLSWFKSDNKTILSVDLTGKDVAIRDVKFCVRKVSIIVAIAIFLLSLSFLFFFSLSFVRQPFYSKQYQTVYLPCFNIFSMLYSPYMDINYTTIVCV